MSHHGIVVSYFQTNPYWNSSFCATLSNFKSQSCADWKGYGSKSTRDINHSFSFPSGWLSIRALHNSLWCWSKSATATVFGSHRHRTWSPPGFSTKGLTVLSPESRILSHCQALNHWNLIGTVGKSSLEECDCSPQALSWVRGQGGKGFLAPFEKSRRPTYQELIYRVPAKGNNTELREGVWNMFPAKATRKWLATKMFPHKQNWGRQSMAKTAPHKSTDWPVASWSSVFEHGSFGDWAGSIGDNYRETWKGQ